MSKRNTKPIHRTKIPTTKKPQNDTTKQTIKTPIRKSKTRNERLGEKKVKKRRKALDYCPYPRRIGGSFIQRITKNGFRSNKVVISKTEQIALPWKYWVYKTVGIILLISSFILGNYVSLTITDRNLLLTGFFLQWIMSLPITITIFLTCFELKRGRDTIIAKLLRMDFLSHRMPFRIHLFLIGAILSNISLIILISSQLPINPFKDPILILGYVMLVLGSIPLYASFYPDLVKIFHGWYRWIPILGYSKKEWFKFLTQDIKLLKLYSDERQEQKLKQYQEQKVKEKLEACLKMYMSEGKIKIIAAINIIEDLEKHFKINIPNLNKTKEQIRETIKEPPSKKQKKVIIDIIWDFIKSNILLFN
ncbi:MAG: hypothetical protein ACTSUV_01915 [Candidatus Ranarchaeia archaeon]